MQRALSASDFDIRDIKKEAMTVYVVLPPNLLETHSRFMRMFVNLANRGMSQGPKPAHPVLFVLDEFFALGRLALMEKSAGLMAGFGLKLWPIVQNMGQLRHLYPRNWEAFVANAGAVQAFWRQRQYDVRVSDRADGQDGAPGSDREFYPAGCRGIARNAGGRARGIAADEQATGVSLWRAANGA
jgi:type IV secretory pathway TraG/TraD family ATPase VirD4